MACAICQTRRPSRFCPGVAGEICSVCCGTEREVTVNCPLDCEYLQQARKRDPMTPGKRIEVPDKDMRMTKDELRKHEELIVFMAAAVLQVGLKTPGVVDVDVREALDAMVRTYRTLQSGLYYETRPENPKAGEVSSFVQNAVEEFRRRETERMGSSSTRDGDVLKILVFLQHFALDRDNGRRLGRAFLDALRGFYPPPEAPSLILP